MLSMNASDSDIDVSGAIPETIESFDTIRLKIKTEPIGSSCKSSKQEKDRDCESDRMRYKHPSDMTCLEKVEFKRKYRDDFTIRDYENWLTLYTKDMYNLKEYHQSKLIKLLEGGTLTRSDMPHRRLVPSMQGDEYFAKMYNDEGKFMYEREGLDNGGLLGANYSDYHDFIPPQLLQHTWITGKKDLFKSPKDNTKSVDYYLRPSAVVGIDETQIGTDFRDKTVTL